MCMQMKAFVEKYPHLTGHLLIILQMSASEQDSRLRQAEVGELLLPWGLGKQEQTVPLVLPEPPVQTLRQGKAGAAAQADVPSAALIGRGRWY